MSAVGYSLKNNPSNVLELWDFVTRPHPRIETFVERRQARLLTALQVIIFVAAVIVMAAIADVIEYYNDDDEQMILAAVAALIPAYAITRWRGNYRVGGWILVGIAFAAGMFLPFVDGASNVLYTLATLPILLAGYLFNTRAAIGVLTAVMATSIAILFLHVAQVGGVLNFYIIMTAHLINGTAVIVFKVHRDNIEKMRRADLEHQVAERTAELAKSKHETEEALEKALVADQLKSQFLASMSHELRTPLNSILTFSELLEMGAFGDVNDEQRDYLGKVLFSGKHLLALINDVLDITKIQSGMLKLFIEDDFDVKGELNNVISTGQNLLGDKDVSIIAEMDNDFAPLSVDKRRIRQILLNLMSNAVKFTEAGTITVRATQHDNEVLFAVIDTGPGISEDQHHIVFEPFEQTETGIKHAGGTGLGFANLQTIGRSTRWAFVARKQTGRRRCILLCTANN